MANDIDLWNDIEELEKLGYKVEANSLMKIYLYTYIEDNEKKLNKAKAEHLKKFSYLAKI